MQTESVQIIIGGKDVSGPAFASARTNAASLSGETKQYAGAAQSAARAGRLLANSLGASHFADMAGQIAGAAGQLKSMNAQLAAGGKGAGLLKVGIVAAIGSLAVGGGIKLGQLLDDFFLGTTARANEAKRNLEDLNTQHARMVSQWSKGFGLKISMVDFMPKGDQSSAFAKLTEQLTAKLKSQEDQVARNNQKVIDLESGWNRFFASQRSLDSANADLQNSKNWLETIKNQLDEVSDKSSVAAANMAFLKKEAEGRAATISLIDSLEKELASKTKTKGELVEQSLRDNMAGDPEKARARFLQRQIENADMKKAVDDLQKKEKDAELDYINALKIKNTELREGKTAAAEHKAELEGVGKKTIENMHAIAAQNDKLEEQVKRKKEQEAAEKNYVDELRVKNTEMREGKHAAEELKAIQSGASKEFVAAQRSLVNQNIALKEKADLEKLATKGVEATEGRLLSRGNSTNHEQQTAQNTAKMTAQQAAMQVLMNRFISVGNTIAQNTLANQFIGVP